MDQEHKKQLETALDKIKKEIPELVAVVLFGTFGSEYETQQSDLDLAFLSKCKLDPVLLWNLSQEVARALKRDVDLIDLREASTVFRFQVLSTGIVIFCSNEQEYAQFDTASFTMYFDFQETRKGILEDYEKGNLKYG